MDQQTDQLRELLWDHLTASQTDQMKASHSLPLSAWPMEPQKERSLETQTEHYSASQKETRWVTM